MPDVTNQQVIDTVIDTVTASFGQALQATEQKIMSAVGEQLKTITDTMVTKEEFARDLKASEKNLNARLKTLETTMLTKMATKEELKVSEQRIISTVGEQLVVIADTMVTKTDLRASEQRQALAIERALTKHVVTWHAAQLGPLIR